MAETTRVRILYAWQGNGRPFAPGSVVDIASAEAADRIRAGHAERVSDETPTSSPAARQGARGAAIAAPAEDSSGGQGASAPAAPGAADGIRSEEALRGVLGGRVSEIVGAIAEIDSAAELEALEALEGQAAKPRKGVLEPLAARRVEVVRLAEIAALVRRADAGELDLRDLDSDDLEELAEEYGLEAPDLEEAPAERDALIDRLELAIAEKLERAASS